jgi:hypothetical protein
VTVAAVCCTAAGAAGSSAHFQLSIVATTQSQWDHTTAPVASGDCTTSQRSEGVLDTLFRTRRPVRVRFVGGRIVPVDVGPLDGSATFSGTNTLNEICPTSESQTPKQCNTTSKNFSGAKTHASSTRPGSITLGRLRVRLATIDCPLEPVEVTRDPLGPVPGPLRVSTRTLANSRFARITLTASASRRIKYGPLEQGTLQQRSLWRMTLQRVAP